MPSTAFWLAAMLKTLIRTRSAPLPPPADLHGVRVVPNSRARRLALRVDAKLGDVVLTWPKRTSLHAAEKFVRENMDWVERHRAKITPVRNFDAGARIPLAGKEYTIVPAAGRGVTRIEGDTIIVHGDAAHLHRRVRDFIKAESLRQLTALSAEKAATLGLKPTSVRVLDPKSRWGSCGSDGKLMYSWRIIFAPPEVMDYLVAHETAHRIHMNHGPAFWRLCASLTTDAKSARRWLRDHGKTLMAWK
ncbi:MAG: SprT family zinc-dependent metalloprotease [Alphaproteobacteria bacterium]|nr:SprT family zinc-dependent metalloprotease [Alphaproteobacteria bacterium]